MAESISSSTTVVTATNSTTGADTRPTRPEVKTTPAERQVEAAGGNTAPAEPSQQRSAQELAQATQDISDYIQTVSRSLQISVDADVGATVIRVLDSETEEVVRQIPSEEIMQIARFIADQQANADTPAAVKGLLMDSES